MALASGRLGSGSRTSRHGSNARFRISVAVGMQEVLPCCMPGINVRHAVRRVDEEEATR